ncbi:MAG: DNA (cytosine-5-)-methyltransferase [Chloroflexi bacterium]|nr:DNA (cytosine-5-)-methyltransferase [Chloroflexota bacterium]
MPYQITEERREAYRQSSKTALRAKYAALRGDGPAPLHAVNTPRLRPEDLMPMRVSNGLRVLSLFSGGGGLDLGFERAGFEHVASFDVLEICGRTLLQNRPSWTVCAGEQGDVRRVDWSAYSESVDVLHGGPPCQPFSTAGRQQGHLDDRDMWPEMIRAIKTVKPRAFIAENVPGLLTAKFSSYVQDHILAPLSGYRVFRFKLHAPMFGVPQSRQRVFFVGFADNVASSRFREPAATHYFSHLTNRQAETIDLFSFADARSRCMGVREALGLHDIGTDSLAPTLRSGFTGPRNSTSILNSVAGQRAWEALEIWPNGVALSRESASAFVAKNGHFRLAVQDCAIIQGFPESWCFAGGVYQVLGQIGNSVAPPMAYRVACAVADALL